MNGDTLTQKKAALDFLRGLKQDINGSIGGLIDIESSDLEQIDNCIQQLEGKMVTRERLVQINEEWMKDCLEDGWLDKPLVEIHAAWQDPDFPEDCAQYIWEKL